MQKFVWAIIMFDLDLRYNKKYIVLIQLYGQRSGLSNHLTASVVLRAYFIDR